MNVGNVDVDLNNLETGGALNLLDNVATNCVGNLDDGDTVLDDYGNLDSCLGLTLLSAVRSTQ